jgi:hypothetical protein
MSMVNGISISLTLSDLQITLRRSGYVIGPTMGLCVSGVAHDQSEWTENVSRSSPLAQMGYAVLNVVNQEVCVLNDDGGRTGTGIHAIACPGTEPALPLPNNTKTIENQTYYLSYTTPLT